MDLPTLERWIVRAGFAVKAENATTVQVLHGDAELPSFFVQLSEHWVLLSMLPLRSAAELGADDLGRRLLEANREMRVAKFALDAEGAVVLCAELPTESLDESELADAVRRVVHYGKDLGAE
jgi:Tir chaperone protein (CesT) family